ncbi:MAG TPA: VOC family protein [Lacunisphaera sp.]
MKPLPRLSFFLALAAAGVLSRAADAPRFNHVAFYVVDLKVSADFYRDVVGLPVIPEPFHDGKHAWFEIGPKQALHIISGAEKVLSKEKRTHLCLSMPSVDAFAARLAQHKVSYENLAGEKSAITRRPDGVNQIYFQDPDGNWIEINDAKA